MHDRKRLIVVGKGGFGRELMAWILHARRGAPDMFFLDDLERGYDVIPSDKYIREGRDELYVAIGHPGHRQRVVENLLHHGVELRQFPVFTHPSVIRTPSATVGAGVILCPNSLVSVSVSIGSFTLVNIYASVDHDVKVGEFVTIGPHVDLCGHSRVGNSVRLGSGSRVLPGCVVGSGAEVGAGTVISADLPVDHLAFSARATAIRRPRED